MKLDNPSCVSWTYMLKGENQFSQFVFWPPHICHGTCVQTHTQKEKNVEKENFSLKDIILKTKTSHRMGEKYFPFITIDLVKQSHLQNTGRMLTIYKSDNSIKTPAKDINTWHSNCQQVYTKTLGIVIYRSYRLKLGQPHTHTHTHNC